MLPCDHYHTIMYMYTCVCMYCTCTSTCTYMYMCADRWDSNLQPVRYRPVLYQLSYRGSPAGWVAYMYMYMYMYMHMYNVYVHVPVHDACTCTSDSTQQRSLLCIWIRYETEQDIVCVVLIIALNPLIFLANEP